MARLGIGAVVVVLVACLCAVALAYAATGHSAIRTCDGALGECAAEDGDELGTALRRSLLRQPTNRYISYAALRADQVPCNKRGRSYYNNCASQRQANPYQRGCSAITRCSRNMN